MSVHVSLLVYARECVCAVFVNLFDCVSQSVYAFGIWISECVCVCVNFSIGLVCLCGL